MNQILQVKIMVAFVFSFRGFSKHIFKSFSEY